MAKRSFSKSSTKAKPATFFIMVAVILLALLLATFGISIPVPGQTDYLELKGARSIRFGIDISGGVEAVFAPKNFQGVPTEDQLNSARSIIELRLDKNNILDRDVTTDSKNGRILVRFPRKSGDTQSSAGEALKELGETALLTFKEPDGKVVLSGADVVKATPAVDTQSSEPIVQLELSSEGAQKFAEATARLVGQKISIYMDETMISDPVVETAITGGNAIITKIGKVEDAVALANKISAGALPFALQSISSSQISPTLGKEALNVMTSAGLVAFLLICVFMIAFYRLPGFVACFSLLAQTIGILLSISIPQQTLTLQGIAGIILSIGMGVDANIIIAERIKEEIRSNGGNVLSAIKNGFTRGSSAVVDGNVTVAIAAVTLMVFGSGTLYSFGYSLLFGTIFNTLIGVLATRLMIESLSNYKALRSPRLYGGKRVQA